MTALPALLLLVALLWLVVEALARGGPEPQGRVVPGWRRRGK